MTVNRREFLKMTGITTLMGIGGVSAFQLLQPGELESTQPYQGVMKKKRWAMVVDMSRFKSESDYKKCIDACYSAHNIPRIYNPNHEIKWIWTESFEHAFPGQGDQYLTEDIKDKPFLVLCNHCEKPPCVRVCPTKATFKRKDGIVTMDYHRCIGCRFCMAACPFGARSFNFRDPRPFIKEADKNKNYPTRMRGVVEKCNFCVERLHKGLLPACVEKSDGAMVFGDLNDPDSKVRKLLRHKFAIRRKHELGTYPGVYYIIGGNENA